MDLFIRYVLNGVGNGAVYASVALALVLIFRTTGLLNLAQGEMALFSTYFAWKLTSLGLSVFVAIPLTVVASMVGGAVIERVLIRPVHGPDKSPLNVLIVMLGMFLALNALAQLVFSDDAEPMPKPWASVSSPGDPTGADRIVELLGVRFSWSVIGLVVALLAECALLYVLFQRTKVGLKLRAVASNGASARLVGINSSAMLMLGWALAAGLGALAGSLVAADRGSVNPGLMAVVLVYSFAAAALGGFDSPVGAVVGGMIVAIAEALTTGYVKALSTIELVVPFALILLVLVVRPTGLFGKKVVERV
ncbi:MAG TPA: branched-chain amino acid ABC transporter permease [Acidimicrobiales bacterium]|nr:branched-chain amino acid ABC transporter permease [Acidimicrobiales bacterium]